MTDALDTEAVLHEGNRVWTTEGYIVAHCDNVKDAAFIVLATSLHHELVAALEATLCELSHCATQLAARGLTGHKDDSVSRAQAAARAVLAKAKQPNLEEPRG